jgi:ComEC/Rec2-related protein
VSERVSGTSLGRERRATSLGRTWAAALALGVGAAGGAHLWPGVSLMAVAVGSGALVLRRRPLAALAGLTLVGLGAGTLAVSYRLSAAGPLADIAERAPRCHIEGRVAEQLGGLGTLIVVERATCPGVAVIRSAGAVAADLPSATAGARVEADGWLMPLRGDRFDTQRRRLGAVAKLQISDVVIGRVTGIVATAASTIRAGLQAASSGLAPPHAALLRGLVIGDTAGMDPSAEDSLRRAGLSHLVAVSGSNVAIVLVAIAAATRPLALLHRVAIGAIGLALYVAAVGPEPSVLRAATMGAIGLVAMATGLRTEPLQALGIALIVLVAMRPGIVFSVGLHLSVSATAGIVLWTRPVKRRLPFLPDVIATILAATIAAQAAVAPVLVLVFGELSVVAPLANLLAAPAVPAATIAGLAAALVSVVTPALGALGATAASPAVAWILYVGRVLGTPEWATVDLPRWVGWALAAPALLAAAAAIQSRSRSSRPTILEPWAQ